MAHRPDVSKIVSGGQTGVDRAALDVALRLGLPCGGWVPKGRRAEDGPLAPVYPVRETTSSHYEERTYRNVRDADATLILTRGAPTGGTALTVACAKQLRRPCFVLDLDRSSDPVLVREWLAHHRVGVLNIAGPRESSAPGIYAQTVAFLTALLETG